MPGGPACAQVERLLRRSDLNTVCRSANCPNLGQCWSRNVATFMILGDTCTRQCLFCAVTKGQPGPLDPGEPQRVADAAEQMGLKHVVVTSVTRDDLDDEGAGAFAETIDAIRKALPESTVEVLTPDFHARRELLDIVCRAGPDVFNHNIETVEALAPAIRPQADYGRSLNVLGYVTDQYAEVVVKSGLMVGLGETEDQIRQTLRDLAGAGCRIVTVGQYLAPSQAHHPVATFYRPEWFDELTDWAKAHLPGTTVCAAPFVRSSYLADEVFDMIGRR